MSLFSVLKKNAKLALRDNWGKAIGIALIVGGASTLLLLLRALALDIFVPAAHAAQPDPAFAAQYGFTAFFFEQFARLSPLESVIICVFAVLEFLLLAPLTLGVVHWFLELVRGHTPALSAIFHYFESAKGYARALWLEFNLLVRSLLWALLFFAAPGGILGVCVFIVSRESPTRPMLTFASIGTLLSAVLFLLAAVFYLAFLNRYALAAYLVCEDGALPARRAVRDSIRFTKGFRFSLLWFSLSFAGWLALCVFVLPALYVLPYMNAATILYYRYIAEKSRFSPPDPTREFGVAQAGTETLADAEEQANTEE